MDAITTSLLKMTCRAPCTSSLRRLRELPQGSIELTRILSQLNSRRNIYATSNTSCIPNFSFLASLSGKQTPTFRPSVLSHASVSDQSDKSRRRLSSTSVRNYSQTQQTYGRFAKNLLPRPGTTVETYIAYGLTQKLFEVCSAQADYKIPQVSQKGVPVPKTVTGEDLGVGEGWWYTDLGLLPTFSTWSQVTFLHMYLLTVRLRALPSTQSLHTYSRHLIDHFSHNAEQRMDVLHGLTSRSIRNKYLKDLFIQWRGILAAYDEGLVKGDAVLGAAVWRNLWKASHTGPEGQEMDWTKVAHVVAYMRRVLSELARVEEADLIFAMGRGSSGGPGIFGYNEVDKKLMEGKR